MTHEDRKMLSRILEALASISIMLRAENTAELMDNDARAYRAYADRQEELAKYYKPKLYDPTITAQEAKLADQPSPDRYAREPSQDGAAPGLPLAKEDKNEDQSTEGNSRIDQVNRP